MSTGAAARFAALFAGYSKAHGVYRVKGRDERGKMNGTGSTVSGPGDLSKHLSGEKSIGSIALLDDNKLTWAAIDVDQYEIPIQEVWARVNALKLPVLCCESKSGGTHVYIFLADKQDPDLVRNTLSSWAAKLGFGGSEVFPKQSYRLDESDIGNWINLPYYASNERMCWNGERWLTLDEFLDAAEAGKTLLDSQPTQGCGDDDLKGAPPCLCHFAATGGAPEGLRNNTVYELAVYCRKRWPDNWQEKVHKLVPVITNPPLAYSEVQGLIKSFPNKNYDNRCQGPYCDRNACRKAANGRGDQTGGATCEIGGVVKLMGDPVYWMVEIEGVRVKLNTEQLQSQTLFNRACMETINRCPAALPQPKWLALLDSKIKVADVINAPEEASKLGQFKTFLGDYINAEYRQGAELKDVLAGSPWKDEVNKVFVFRSVALFQFLDQRKFNYVNNHQAWLWLRELHAEAETVWISDKAIKVWKLPISTLFD